MCGGLFLFEIVEITKQNWQNGRQRFWEMENSVIILDSSEDEGEDATLKKMSKTPIMKKTRVNYRSKEKATSNIGLPLVNTNKTLNQQSRSAATVAPTATTAVSKIASRGAITISTVRTKRQSPIPATAIVNNSSDKDRRPPPTTTGVPGEKNFIRKIDSGEISIVPIAVSPLLTPSTSPNSTITASTIKRKPSSSSAESPIDRKRICPLKISEVVTMARPNQANNSITFSNDVKMISGDDNDSSIAGDGGSDDDASTIVNRNKSKKPKEKTPLSEEFVKLLDTCRRADASADMEKLINRKLIRYYQIVHPDFVSSKSFMKTIRTAMDEIEAQPELVYLKISSVLEELNIRRKSGESVVANDQVASTGNAHKDSQIRKLNKALYMLKKKIAQLDEADVDWDEEDNSQFMISERLKKRATEIYEKICDITGESKNAQRLVKKPIKFQETSYPEFNKTLQRFINETRMFPDMFDVLRCLEHCNLENNYRLSKEDCKKIAQEAFLKVGKLLQKRRKTDLYETVSYFAGSQSDPALEDQILQSKLAENQKFHKQINDIIDRYALQQDKNNPTISTESQQKHANKSNDTSSTAPTSAHRNCQRTTVDDDDDGFNANINDPLGITEHDEHEENPRKVAHDHVMSTFIDNNTALANDGYDDDNDHRSAPTILSIETLQTTDLFASDSKKHDREIVISSDDEDRDL